MVNDIKADLQKMDQRIQYLEEDAYYYHDGDDWEKDESKESPVTSNTAQTETQSWNTPIGQTSQPFESMFSYQRKRQAFESPEQTEIQRKQHSLYSRIDELGTHLENITESLSQLTDTQLQHLGNSTPQFLSQP